MDVRGEREEGCCGTLASAFRLGVPLRKAVLDFDKTITVADSTDVVVASCREVRAKIGDEALRKFDSEVETIFNSYSAQYAKLMEEFRSVRLLPDTKSVVGIKDLRAALNDFFEKERAMEIDSALDISKKGLLSGLTKEEWRRIGKEKVTNRDNALDAIRAFQAAGVEVFILSANWCSDMIYGSLDGLVHDERIFANRHKYDPATQVSTGELDMAVVSGLDKLRVFKEIKQRAPSSSSASVASSTATESAKGLTMYVGDSPNDLLALLEADIPVVMEGNRYLLPSLDHLKVAVRPLDHQFAGTLPPDTTLYKIGDWNQLLRALSQ